MVHESALEIGSLASIESDRAYAMRETLNRIIARLGIPDPVKPMFRGEIEEHLRAFDFRHDRSPKALRAIQDAVIAKFDTPERRDFAAKAVMYADAQATLEKLATAAQKTDHLTTGMNG